MAPERLHPGDICQMRESVHYWLNQRPTITHTPCTLLSLTMGELKEFKEALKEDNRKGMIRESGDILFSLLALDARNTPIILPETNNMKDPAREIVKNVSKIKNRRNSVFIYNTSGISISECGYHYIDAAYRGIAQLAYKEGTNIESVFAQTECKNKTNYPRPFFNEATPFAYYRDAFICLRLLRKTYGDPENPDILDQKWYEVDSYLNQEMSFYDQYWAIGNFRTWINEFLEKTVKGNDPEDSSKAKKLLAKGHWGMQPLRLEIFPADYLKWK